MLLAGARETRKKPERRSSARPISIQKRSSPVPSFRDKRPIAKFSLTGRQIELQALLSGPATHCLLYGGSRSGKTFLLCYAVLTRALRAEGSRHAIFRRTGASARQSIGRDTLPKVAKLAYGLVPEFRSEEGCFLLPNGSEIWLSGLEDRERLDKVLGREYATIYLNEASEITYQAFSTVKTRLAQKAAVTAGGGTHLPLKCYVDLNPTTQSHWTYRVFVEGAEPEGRRPLPREDYAFGVAGPLDNAENLPAAYIESLKHLPRSQRMRFFEGAYAGDSADSLWTRQSIGRLYAESEADLPVFRRVAVAIDPAVSSHAGSNETGIIVAATDGQGQGHVLADGSGVMKPDEWARKAVTLFHYYRADCIVAEANQGGEMVETTLRAVAPDIPVKLVRASRGKYVRAEPVAALYARGRVRHVGEFRELEDQMCSFTPDFDRKAEGFSPDRVDALVWALSELFPGLISDRQRGANRAQALAMGDYDVFGG